MAMKYSAGYSYVLNASLLSTPWLKQELEWNEFEVLQTKFS